MALIIGVGLLALFLALCCAAILIIEVDKLEYWND